MFSVVVAGRLPLPAPQQIDETHAIFPLEDTTNINHVTVFMTGQQAFPPGFAATVHLNWKTEGQDKWIMLGCLKNEKPSAIFRLKGLTQTQQSSGSGADDAMMGMGNTQSKTVSNSAGIGISIESIENVDSQMTILRSSNNAGRTDIDGMQTDSNGSNGSNGSNSLVKFGQIDEATQTQLALAMAPKIASNIFSYLSSFAPDSAPQTVPLLKRWLEQFERKLKAQGIGFLARTEAE